jgi:hypothetical protein
LNTLPIENYFHRYSLNDLGEIAGRIVRREQGKNGTRPRLEAVDLPGEFSAWDRVDRYFNGWEEKIQLKLGT